ncbi:MAG: glycosyltransferase [Vicinamibacterales bacterium]
MHRIAFYSHDTMGLGHVRRNLALARAIVDRHVDVSILLISGTHLGGAFHMPAGIDCITLPALGKHQMTGAYSARHLSCPLDHIVGLRSQTIRAALERFDPHLLIVDNVPLGALGELEPTLAALRMGRRIKTVLGLRDILDEPSVVAREWAAAGHHASIERYYDQVWIYGDPSVYDLSEECHFPESTRHRVRFVGYLDRRSPHDSEAAASTGAALARPFTLCLAGGGQDGTELALAFSESSFPGGETGVLLTGPFCPEPALKHVRAVAATRDDFHLIDFTDDGASLVERATRVVGMAGYNSVCEILAYRKPALLVPREAPRREQTIRATRFAEIGLVDVLAQRDLSSQALTRWMATVKTSLRPATLRFTALEQVPRLVSNLLSPDQQPTMRPIAAKTRATGAGVHVH